MFPFLKKRSFQKSIEKALSKRDVSQLNNTLVSLGILYNGDVIKDVSVFKEIASSLQVSEKEMSCLQFVTFNKKETSLPQDAFTNKDFNWKGSLKSDTAKTFVKQNFDVLLCFYDGPHRFLDVLNAKSKAKFKVGFKNSEARYIDLQIQVALKDNTQLINELKKYLSILGKI